MPTANNAWRPKDGHGAHEVLASNTYFDSRFGVQAAKILPGEFYVSGNDVVLVTVLGSCVAACVRDTVTGIGGMNHFMLPKNGEEQYGVCAPSARYGVHAMEMLLNELIKRGAQRANLEAKVFGGGNVMSGMRHTQVGAHNADFVLDYIERERLPLAAADLLDDCARKVYFFPRSGRVLVKKLRTLHNDTVLRREEDYVRRLADTHVEGSVELFQKG
ncbi:MAG TPA: chemoreceptor glutamine deamidase CheD [Burkholderiales bacterium]